MFRSILIALADPTVDAGALKAAVRLARASAARLHVVHVRERNDDSAAKAEADLLRAADWAATELSESVSFRLLNQPTGANPKAAVAQALGDYALQQNIDLIVLARRRHSLNRLLLGSVGERLLFSQDAPILFIPQLEHTLPARGCRIMLPLDGTRGSETVLDDALNLARALKGSLSLLRVLEPVPEIAGAGRALDAFVREEGGSGAELAEGYLERIAERAENLGVKTRWLTLTGQPVSELRKSAADQRSHIIALAPRASSVLSQESVEHREGRCARRARRDDEGIAALFRGGATQPCGMQRPSNANGFRTQDTGEPLHFAHNSVTERLLRKGETALLLRRRPAGAV